MADRYFLNVMPDFVPEDPNIFEEEDRERQGRIEIHPQGTQDSLLRFLSLPYSALSQQLQRAALDLKETENELMIVCEKFEIFASRSTGFRIAGICRCLDCKCNINFYCFYKQIVVETWGLSRQLVEDFTLYAGTLGTAYLLFKCFQVTHNKNDLSLCLDIVKACDSSSAQSSLFQFSPLYIVRIGSRPK